MGDWHPELKQFIPKSLISLDYSQAQQVLNGLHVFIASLERGRPATFVQRREEAKKKKYWYAEQAYIFDRGLADLYTMTWDDQGLILVTVTWIGQGADHILDDPKPRLRFEDVDRIVVPYQLAPEIQEPEFSSIRTPLGRDLELVFEARSSSKKSFWIGNKPEPAVDYGPSNRTSKSGGVGDVGIRLPEIR
jgi:hypothetical protein